VIYAKTGLPWRRALGGSRNGQVGKWCNRCGARLDTASGPAQRVSERPTPDALQDALRARLLMRVHTQALRTRGTRALPSI